jgi:DHA3 family tetracycline resistance protein-like MFS transporter
VSVVGFALVTHFPLAIALLWMTTTCRNVSQPVSTAWLNRHMESHVRATLLSLGGQRDILGQIAGGPVVGAIGTFASLRAAITTAGAALTPALLLFARAARQSADQLPAEAAEPMGTLREA